MACILVVENDEALRRVTHAQLEKSGHQASAAADVAQALDILRKEPKDLVLSDLNLPGVSGMELLKSVRNEYPETAVIMITAYGTVGTAVEAVKCGAYDYITKPFHPDELLALVDRALERRRLLQEVRTLRGAIDRKFGFEDIIGSSGSLMRALDLAASVAHTDATVLLIGETGTGKELLAKAIHANSPRSQRPFVNVSCGSMPRELLESELFGHIKGSSTGASTHKKGKIELADGGTVLLDEIGELPMELQVRVLRLVQEHEIEKIGAANTQKVNVRIVAATHRNLEDLVARRLFREDLYYRLSAIPIELPPLRDRKEDIPLLLDEFFERAKHKYGKPQMYLPAEIVPYFVDYRWPGNIRELENVVERIVLLGRSDEVTAADLPDTLRAGRNGVEAPGSPVETESASPVGVERELIVQALRKCNWDQMQAARHLDISRKTLLYHIARYGIEKGA